VFCKTKKSLKILVKEDFGIVVHQESSILWQIIFVILARIEAKMKNG